jgi:hypothetical protein
MVQKKRLGKCGTEPRRPPHRQVLFPVLSEEAWPDRAEAGVRLEPPGEHECSVRCDPGVRVEKEDPRRGADLRARVAAGTEAGIAAQRNDSQGEIGHER